MEGETLPEPDTAVMSSSSRGEKHTETQENVFVKRRLMAKSPKRPITLVPSPEDPVKRTTEENGHEKRRAGHECRRTFDECCEHAHKRREHARGKFERRQ